MPGSDFQRLFIAAFVEEYRQGILRLLEKLAVTQDRSLVPVILAACKDFTGKDPLDGAQDR